jgi:hypothetical protein
MAIAAGDSYGFPGAYQNEESVNILPGYEWRTSAILFNTKGHLVEIIRRTGLTSLAMLCLWNL